MKVDFQFLALVICSVFGWTLKDVFSLTWGQFCYIASEVRHVQYFRGKNENYFSICAAFGDKNTQKDFLKQSEGFVIQSEQPENMSYTKEDLMAAEKRMRETVQPEVWTKEEKQDGV